jgi:hypothetical protein
MQEKVKYFIVGAPKCASTSLYNLFETDPEYSVTTIKETHFFSAEDVAKGNYDDVPIISEQVVYDAQYKGNGVRIDICPSYFASKNAIANIKAYNPDARILCLVRDPIKRAVSHYKMDVSLGYAPADSFDKIWSEKSGQLYEEYFGISEYNTWIDRWKEAFGEEQVFVVNLIDQPFSDSKANVETFLEKKLVADELPVSNVAKTYNLPLPILRKLGLLKIADAIVPQFVRDILKRIVPRKPPFVVHIDDGLKQEISTHYQGEYDLLKTLTQGM